MKILVIESEKNAADFLIKNLKTASFVIDVVGSEEKRLYAARTNECDLIVLNDVSSKKVDVDICRTLRGASCHAPIIVLSTCSEVSHKADILNAGADDYLTKPFSFEELLARIRALLRRPRQIQMEILKIDDLALDTKKHSVLRGRKEIYLTRKEFMLLEYLMRNADIALSRGMLMEHVWDRDVDPFSNTIEAHILSLRRKIDLAGKRKKLIHTVSGVGYKLRVGAGN